MACFFNIMMALFLFFTVIHCSEVPDDECDDRTCEPSTEQIFEGDLLGFNNPEDILIPNRENGDTANNALTDATKKWKNGIVYYTISHQFSCQEKCIIHEAMHKMETKTCLKFVEYGRGDFIEIVPHPAFCASHVGKQGNKQKLLLAPECANSVGHVIHELMHAIGFFHEQSRKDRDDYIDINWDNVPELYHLNFKNHGLGDVTTYNLPYDYESLLHYEPYAFARNESVKTITAKNGREIGQREKMSDLDVERINIHYNCTKHLVNCRDKDVNCGNSKNLKRSCGVASFNKMCPKTCGTCSNNKSNRKQFKRRNCQTANDRCSKYTYDHRHCPNNQRLKHTMSLNCYQGCQTCHQ